MLLGSNMPRIILQMVWVHNFKQLGLQSIIQEDIHLGHVSPVGEQPPHGIIQVRLSDLSLSEGVLGVLLVEDTTVQVCASPESISHCVRSGAAVAMKQEH